MMSRSGDLQALTVFWFRRKLEIAVSFVTPDAAASNEPVMMLKDYNQ